MARVSDASSFQRSQCHSMTGLTSDDAVAAAAAFAATALRAARSSPTAPQSSQTRPLCTPPPKFKVSAAIDALAARCAMNSPAMRSLRLPALLQPPPSPPPTAAPAPAPAPPLPLLHPALLLSSHGGGKRLERYVRRPEVLLTSPADAGVMETGVLVAGRAEAGRVLPCSVFPAVSSR